MEDINYNLMTDLAALMLECAVNGSVSLGELLDNDNENTARITFTDGEKAALNKALADFVQNPLAYDLHEMVPDEDMQEMAHDCENLRIESVYKNLWERSKSKPIHQFCPMQNERIHKGFYSNACRAI